MILNKERDSLGLIDLRFLLFLIFTIMASTFRLKRKLYSDDKGGMSTGKKLALGGLAAGAAILGAKKGAFGANIMAKTNTGLMKAGKAVGGKVGDRMMMSGAKDFGVARAKQIDNALLKKTGSQMTKQAFNAKADQKGMQALGKNYGNL